MKQSDIIYTINEEYHIEIRERKCYNTFRLRLMNSNKERLNEICCPKDKYNYNMQKLISTVVKNDMHYVMRNKETEEMIIISHDDYKQHDLFESDLIYTHMIIYAASYNECLRFCEIESGYNVERH